jgi:hypothetical protein
MDLAEHLSAVSNGLKRKVKTPSEYRDRMRLAVRLVCRERAMLTRAISLPQPVCG